MNYKFLFAFIAILPACTLKPTIRQGDSLVTLGGSIFTKTTAETSSYSGPLGNLSYKTKGNDETVLPSKIAGYYTAKAAIDGLSSAFETQQDTVVIKGSQETARQATKATADIEKTKILNPVIEPEVIPAIDPIIP